MMAAVVRKARTCSAAPRQFEGERLVTLQALAIISRREKEAQSISPMLPSFVRELYLGLGGGVGVSWWPRVDPCIISAACQPTTTESKQAVSKLATHKLSPAARPARGSARASS
jgi:hypothetical protein